MKIKVLTIAIMCALSAVAYGDVFEDFTDLPVMEITKTGFTWATAEQADLSVSPPKSLKLSAGGGTGLAEMFSLWDIGGVYDFYSGGSGICSVQVSRFSTALWIKVELLDVSQNVVASAQHNFTDFNAFHNLDIPLDGDETGVQYVLFTIRRSSGTSTAICYVDDFSGVGAVINHYCGEPGTVYLPADINKDCYVNFKDFAALAQVWLDCTDPEVSFCN